MKHKLLIVVIVFLAFLLRTYGLNWDQGAHLHPDERFLTMVAERLTWPANLSQYFDTHRSTLNPHNMGYPFFVYGTYPVILVKWLSQLVGMHEYGGINLVGRFVSAVVDVGILVTVMAIARKIWGAKESLWSGFIYAIAVLPIQLSHYFATDSYAVFFLMLSLYFLVRLLQDKKIEFALGIGISFGLALAAKISAVVFAPIIALGFLFLLKKDFFKAIVSSLLIGIFTLLSLRIFMPYLFDSWVLNSQVVTNWKELKSYDNPDGYFPPAVQWVNASDYLFPLENMALWGWGLPLFVVALPSLIIVPLKRKNKFVWLIALGIIGIFTYQGMQFAKPMRYFYVLYPLMALLMGAFLSGMSTKLKIILIAAFLVWPLSFMRIYSRDHSRVTASKWIYTNIPLGSNLTCEHWDDCLPLNLEGFAGNATYKGIEMTMFYPDTTSKWQDLSNKLLKADYLILSSSRVYGSTMSVPERFPLNVKFYSLLFSEKLGFEKIAEFTSRPSFPLIPINWCLAPHNISYGIVSYSNSCQGLSFVDDYADETFTVYDHPKVTIFKKTKKVDYPKLLL